MRFGIALQGNKTPTEYAAHAALVDRYAFDVVSVYNDLFFQPALGPLLCLAPHLRHATLGPAALNPYTAHPVEIAGQVAVLDHMTDGRAYLGLARGSWLDQVGLVQRAPVDAVRECILLVRALLAGDTSGFEGSVFRLAPGAELRYPRRRTAVPITVGTWGERMAAVAGELADEVKVGGSANPAVARQIRAPIEAAEQRAGRSAGSVGICLGAVTVVDEDRLQARMLARREVALYAPVVAKLDPSLREEEWLHRIAAPAAQGDYEAVATLLPDAALDRLTLAGTPDDIVRQVADLAAAGVTRVEFGTPHAVDPLNGIRLLGERVLPSLRD